MIRAVLLWASRNEWLSRTLPRQRSVQRAVRRFMPGEIRQDAVRAAVGLQSRGIGAIFTLLGENVSTKEEVEEIVAEYLELLKAIEENGLDAQISIKLTQLGLDLGEDLALGHLLTLINGARDAGSFLWIDMEDSRYKDPTIGIFRKAVEGTDSSSVGLCLQAYLRSTPDDLEELLREGLLPGRPVIRFVKGAYAETPEVAFPRRGDVDEGFFELGVRSLSSDGKAAFATHDTNLVERIRGWIGTHGVESTRYEFQMLYGIRAEEQLRLAEEGEPVRVLISYGPAWFPWYMRRLAERPANLWFVIKNMFRS